MLGVCFFCFRGYDVELWSGGYCFGVRGVLVIYIRWLFVRDEMGSVGILADSGERDVGMILIKLWHYWSALGNV